MIASMWVLSRADTLALKLTDDYSLHRIVYDLFEDVRTEQQKNESIASGFLYVDKGGDFNHRQILIVSNRLPKKPSHGQIKSHHIPESFLENNTYQFEIKINPTKRDKETGKTIAVKGKESIREWFIKKSFNSWGFSVNSETLEVHGVDVKKFTKKNHQVTLVSAHIMGELKVTDKEKFKTSFCKGIGRGRAFGLGLLQIIPINNLS